jgi:hypothetical protein
MEWQYICWVGTLLLCRDQMFLQTYTYRPRGCCDFDLVPKAKAMLWTSDCKMGAWDLRQTIWPYTKWSLSTAKRIIQTELRCSIYPTTSEKAPKIFIDLPDRAIAQAVSRWLPTAAARFREWVRSCGICGGQSGTGAGFLRVLRFLLSIFIPPITPQTPSSIIWGWYNRPMVAAVPSGLSLIPLRIIK